MNGHVKDYTGKKIGLLYVIGFSGKQTPSGNYIWNCVCECGKEVSVSGGNLKDTKSCGCYRYDASLPGRETKKCSRCGVQKISSQFTKNKSRRDGLSQFCKPCRTKIDKEYRPRQREYRNGYQKNKRNNNIQFRIADNLRRRVNYALKGNAKSKRTIAMLGCTVKEFVEHLENKFDKRMSWNNYGSYWHIDHIKPCAAFDLSKEDEQEECFHYSNLQPLSGMENFSKNSWYNGVKYSYG